MPATGNAASTGTIDARKSGHGFARSATARMSGSRRGQSSSVATMKNAASDSMSTRFTTIASHMKASRSSSLHWMLLHMCHFVTQFR